MTAQQHDCSNAFWDTLTVGIMFLDSDRLKHLLQPVTLGGLGGWGACQLHYPTFLAPLPTLYIDYYFYTLLSLSPLLLFPRPSPSGDGVGTLMGIQGLGIPKRQARSLQFTWQVYRNASIFNLLSMIALCNVYHLILSCWGWTRGRPRTRPYFCFSVCV